MLLVDDSEDVRLVLRMRAASWPDLEIVGEAADGHEAVRMIAEVAPDVVVLDHDMPEMTGMEALPELRRRAPDASIVMFIGYEANGPHAVERGADAWVSKLAPWDDLFEIVVACGTSPRDRGTGS